MFKTKLTTKEVLALEIELNGFRDQEQNVLLKGLLNQKLSLLLKFRLTELVQKVAKIRTDVNDAKKLLYKELAEENAKVSGVFEIKHKIKETDAEGNEVEVDNPNFIKLTKELTILDNEIVELEHYPFRAEDFDLQTEEVYPVFLSKILRTETDSK